MKSLTTTTTVNNVYRTFNWKLYLKQNIDLQIAGISTQADAWKHYCMHGIKEGRAFPLIYKPTQNIKTASDKSVDISIVMAYWDHRKPQTLNTLNGFQANYANKIKFEVIIVDDNSSNKFKLLHSDVKSFTFPIKIFEISEEDKGDRLNPCIAYNKGFEHATGRIVVIQNPECMHVGNILEHVLTLQEDEYYSYSCYSLNNELLTHEFMSMSHKQQHNSVLNNKSSFFTKNEKISISWFNNPIVPERNNGYHFCSAIYRSKLKLLGGFSKGFKNGYCFDDDEFRTSVEHILRLNVINQPPHIGFVAHQHHKLNASNGIEECSNDLNKKTTLAKWERNRILFDSIKETYSIHKSFKYPRIMHLYWDGSPFPYLNFLTVLSFNRYHPHWRIVVHVPTNRTLLKTWKSDEQKVPYTGDCYFRLLEKIDNVVIEKIDLNEIGFYNDASEVIKSDYFRYYILYRHGGLWSDCDIIYTSSIEEKMNFSENAVIFKCFIHSNTSNNHFMYYPIGLFLATPKSDFFKYILSCAKSHYNPNEYQSIGATMFKTLFPTDSSIYTVDASVKICNHEYYLPWAHHEIDEFLGKEDNCLPANNIGIHWFNGSNQSRQFINALDWRVKYLNEFTPKCYLDFFIKSYMDEMKSLAKDNVISQQDFLPIYEAACVNGYTDFVSIILPYYNRKRLLKQTLNSFQHHYASIKNLEIIIVDDGSIASEQVANIGADYDLDITVVTLPPKKSKTEVNPCYPYNVGVKASKGNVIVLSSPETLHTTNMFRVTNFFNKLRDDSYLLLSTFCCTTPSIVNDIICDNYSVSKKNLELMCAKLGEGCLSNGATRPSFNNEHGSWYLHSQHKPSHLNFCSVMTRNLYYKLSGFNEKFRNGTGYDDDDFLARLMRHVPKENFIYYDAANAIHVDHEIVHNLAPTTNIELFDPNDLSYHTTNAWGIYSRKKRIGIFCSFGIGGADKVTYLLTQSFVEKHFNKYEFILFYNNWSMPNQGCETRFNHYTFSKLIK